MLDIEALKQRLSNLSENGGTKRFSRKGTESLETQPADTVALTKAAEPLSTLSDLFAKESPVRLRKLTPADRETIALTLYERRLRMALGAHRQPAVPPRGLTPAGHRDVWRWFWTAIELHRRRMPWPFDEPAVVTRVLTDAGIGPEITAL